MWAFEEYEKLRRYDRPTALQPQGLFQCHQTTVDNPHRRLCAGWVGCHDAAHLLGLRLALIEDRISEETFDTAVSYVSPVPLFDSGNDAADRGQRSVTEPDEAAIATIVKILHTGPDIDAHLA